jgi:molecular chaperone IbpA
MTTIDFSPFFRSSIGFDRLQRLMDSTMRLDQGANGYPPYNIEVLDENAYRLTMAMAGFGEDDLSVEVRENTLTVSGRKPDEEQGARYLHRGIAAREFVRKFQIADYVKVVDVHLDNGLLVVDLEREIPEELRPRTIAIKAGAPRKIVSKAKTLIGAAGKKAA